MPSDLHLDRCIRTPIDRLSPGDVQYMKDQVTALRSQLEAVTRERDALLGLDTQWPLDALLETLADGIDHLLGHHDCDALGHEGLRYAERRARAMVTNLRPFAAGRPTGGEGEQ